MITLWHNPRCSKSRQALALLQEAGAEVQVRRYLDDAPSAAELQQVLDLLVLPASGLIRKGEKAFKEGGLAKADEAVLLEAMASTPILIERPVAITQTRAAIGRPPENVLALLPKD